MLRILCTLLFCSSHNHSYSAAAYSREIATTLLGKASTYASGDKQRIAIVAHAAALCFDLFGCRRDGKRSKSEQLKSHGHWKSLKDRQTIVRVWGLQSARSVMQVRVYHIKQHLIYDHKLQAQAPHLQRNKTLSHTTANVPSTNTSFSH